MPRSLGRPQVLLLTVLRVVIGWHFLYEGLVKLLGKGWSSAAYLDSSRWWLSGLFHWIVSVPQVMTTVDLINIWGQIAIGLALILGLYVRGAALGGAVLLLLYYMASPPIAGVGLTSRGEGNYLVVDRNLIEAIALAVLAFLPAASVLGLDRIRAYRASRTTTPAEHSEGDAPPAADGLTATAVPSARREILAGLSTLPVLGGFAYAVAKRKEWTSYEEKNLSDAKTAASAKTLNMASLKELRGTLPKAKVGNREFSRLILGGNLLSGWAHSRDLVYVSQLVKAYHHKDKIFETLLLAEKCGVNTLLTNPILATVIDEYWKRRIGNIQFISDCVGVNYDAKGSRSPGKMEDFLSGIKRAIDYGACACYIQGETADQFVTDGQGDRIGKAMDLMRQNKVLAGIGAHSLETVQACVTLGHSPDFWMKTFHHLDYWSARHPEEHDNKYCNNPDETMAFMKERPEPWIAFKVMAAGAIHPKEAFRHAFEGGADFICAGMYDFQMVEDVNIATDILGGDLTKRQRAWRA